MIRIVIADDHAIVRAGVRALFSTEDDLSVVGEAADGREAVAEVRRHNPDVLLLDLTMPEANGIDAITQVCAACPSTRVVVLSMHASAEYVRPAIRAGASGYVVKGSGLEALVDAVRAVAAGENFFDSKVAAMLRENDGVVDPLDRLTPREREVLQLVAEGLTNREMAARLGVSAKTVDTHRTSLMRKLDLHDAPSLTRFAVRRGLVSPE